VFEAAIYEGLGKQAWRGRNASHRKKRKENDAISLKKNEKTCCKPRQISLETTSNAPFWAQGKPDLPIK
jgi:hypothetical protein